MICTSAIFDWLISADDTTGYFLPRRTGRLRVEIIWHSVDNDHTTENLFDIEPACDYCAPARTLIYKNRREVASVHGMLTIPRIVVRTGVGERILRRTRTRHTFMNMKTQNRITALPAFIRKSEKGR